MEHQRSSSRQSSEDRALPSSKPPRSAKPQPPGKPQPRARQEMNSTEADLFENIEMMNRSRYLSPLKHLEPDYQPADFSRAVEYKLSRSYFLKDQKGSYRKIGLLEETKSLKHFGLGPYFYVEFMRRVCWVFFWLSLVELVRVLINARSAGMADYSVSFSTYLITTTLANFNHNSLCAYDPYILSLAPALLFLVVFGFYLCWKCHFYSEINKEEEDAKNIKPEKFCLKITCERKDQMTEPALRKVFENFGPVYEISLVRRHNDKLEYFQELEEIEERIRQEELEATLGEGNPEELKDCKKAKQALTDELKGIRIEAEVTEAYVHFQYEKSKVECLSYFNSRFLFENCCHRASRQCCCCCLPEVAKKFKLQGRHALVVREEEVPAPEDINWESGQLSGCSRACRYLCAFLVICAFLALSCTIIGVCTIYVSTHSSNCDAVAVPQTLTAAQASTDPAIKLCYCNANLLASLTDAGIKSYCQSQLQGLYIEQGVQYIIILTSAITNFLFGVLVERIVNFTKPSSQSQSLKVKTLVYTLFLIFNTVFLPILLYADIFGFKTSSYFSFITLISAGLKSFLQIDALQFYLDYSPIWYRNVSPMFTNFVLLDILTTWASFVVSKLRASYMPLSNKEGLIIQKHMNEQIVAFQFSPYKEYSAFLMVFFMAVFLSPGIPVLLPLAFLNLLSRYVTNRALIQQDSTRVDGLGTLFNELPHTLLPVLLVVSCLNGCWMLTANSQIYPSALPFSVRVGGVEWAMAQRELYLPFYVVLALLVGCEYVFYHTIIRVCGWVSASCFERKRTVHPSETKTFTEHARAMNILTSYNIKTNDKMRNAVTRLEAYIRKKASK